MTNDKSIKKDDDTQKAFYGSIEALDIPGLKKGIPKQLLSDQDTN